MIYKSRADLHFARRKLHLGQFLNVNPGGKFAHRDREKRRFHRFSHDFTEARIETVVAAYADFIFLFVCWGKEGQSLDMVPMSMRDQQREFDRFRAEFFFQSDPKGANPGTRIEHDNLAIRAHLDAGGVATVTQNARPRHRNGTARPPKLESCGRGWNARHGTSSNRDVTTNGHE